MRHRVSVRSLALSHETSLAYFQCTPAVNNFSLPLRPTSPDLEQSPALRPETGQNPRLAARSETRRLPDVPGVPSAYSKGAKREPP